MLTKQARGPEVAPQKPTKIPDGHGGPSVTPASEGRDWISRAIRLARLPTLWNSTSDFACPHTC